MRWPAISFEKHELKVDVQRTRGGDKEVIKAPKTQASKRLMPIPMFVEKYLKNLKAQQDDFMAYLGSCFKGDGFVIIDEYSKPISLTRVDKLWKEFLEKNDFTYIRLHDLRHSVATNLYCLGVPIEKIAAWLGHASAEVTRKIYAHLDIDMRKEPAEILDSLFGFKREGNKPVTIDFALRKILQPLIRPGKNIYLNENAELMRANNRNLIVSKLSLRNDSNLKTG